MDKRLILAVAGSGKTTHIINKLCLDKKHLLITFTNNNHENLRLGIIRRFGFFPENIKVYTYFSFLYSFCYKPFLSDYLGAKGTTWKQPPRFSRLTDRAHFIDNNDLLYGCRIAKLLLKPDVISDIISRIEKYVDHLYIDEVQDFAGNDFSFLKKISSANVDMLFVGDFFQHTFDTSRDASVNKSLHDNYSVYIKHFSNAGIIIDATTLSHSYRCGEVISDYIRYLIGINIYSHQLGIGSVTVIEPNNITLANDIFYDQNIVKLFYQEHHKYNCFSENWGGSKGNDKYTDVCVVMNDTTYKKFLANKMHDLPPRTINKLYVACSRARRNLYIVPEKILNVHKA